MSCFHSLLTILNCRDLSRTSDAAVEEAYRLNVYVPAESSSNFTFAVRDLLPEAGNVLSKSDTAVFPSEALKLTVYALDEPPPEVMTAVTEVRGCLLLTVPPKQKG